MQTLWRDIKYGFRNLWAKPSVTFVALLALALGIGANTALFSILYAALWKELPYKNAERLVMVWESQPTRDVAQNVVNPANFADWREQNRVFEDMAAFMNWSANLSGDGTPEEVAIQYATPNLFDVLGIHPIRGRTFKKDDGVGDSIIVILSHGLWLRRYGADNAIVGREIFLNGRKATVVGIMPRGFDFFIKKWAMVKKPAQLWVAFPITPENRTRQGRYLSSIARLKPGVSYDEAQANMLVLAQQLEKQYREFNGGWSVSVVPLREQISGQLRKPLWILAGAVAFVLLIACTNVANLMLSRAISRIREMAIRVALGAGRWAIIRQVLTESMLLSLMGGILGVLLALWGTKALSML
ncbi:MAG TPA: ABC transporter permease, partial [Acidobacteriota bacterium]|nr:ABC transporter permease [Acidobacteriota bacterium]